MSLSLAVLALIHFMVLLVLVEGYHYEEDMPKADGVKKDDAYLNVNKTLYDYYKEKCKEPAKDWSGKVTGEDNPYSAMASISEVRVGEVPWTEVNNAANTGDLTAYGDAAIFVIRRNGGEGFDLPATSGENEVKVLIYQLPLVKMNNTAMSVTSKPVSTIPPMAITYSFLKVKRAFFVVLRP